MEMMRAFVIEEPGGPEKLKLRECLDQNLARGGSMLQTAHGSLHTGLEIERADNLLVRGATSSIGFATIALARAAGLELTADHQECR